MKNLKVSMKLIISFLVVLVMTLAVGVVGIVGMLNIDSDSTAMYEKQTVPMPYMAEILELMEKMRVSAREYLIGALTDDAQKIENTYNTIQTDNTTMEDDMDAYYKTILTADAQKVFNEARSLYEKDYDAFMKNVYDLAKQGKTDDILKALDDILPTINKINDDFQQCLTMKVNLAAQTSDSNTKMATTLLIALIAVMALAALVALFFAFYISGLISKPLMPLVAFMTKASKTGDISMTKEEEGFITSFSERKDEIGNTISAAASFFDRIMYISKELETIASGDLTSDIKLLSEKDTMGKSMAQVVSSLNDMFGEINSATGQVSIGSKQVADGAQSLAQGSTEQAASVEELSSSIAEIANKTKENADMATSAASLANTIKENAERGSHQMDEMMNAVKEINQASQNISKVIKVIDDIAFQTNILALNAAVEAARAGQHGKGFAVVAEEVRNLAAKSAEAAKETGDMIQNSMDKAELGARIAGETAESLVEIVSGINESDMIVNEIAMSSEEQANGIRQINVGIDQVAQVIQQNSATAEESAAASEEMSSQANMLESLIAQFKLKNSKSGGRSLQAALSEPRRQLDAAPEPSSGFGGGRSGNVVSGDFGKY